MTEPLDTIWIVFHSRDGTAIDVLNIAADHLGYRFFVDTRCGLWTGKARDALDAIEQATNARLAWLRKTELA